MNARRILVALSLAAWAAVGSAASAQLARGHSGFSDAPRSATEDQYWFFLRELGRCLVQSKRDQSVAFLRTAINSPEEGRAFGALISRRGNNSCMRNMVRATVVRAHVRGVVAENLYKSLPVFAAGGSVPQGFAGPKEVRSIHEFADCYIASNYADARSLLVETRLATQEETDRIRMMAPGFGDCLPQGQQIRIVPIDIRLALAEALYRVSLSRSTPLEGSD
jgi:hypothetical protein